MQPIDTTSYVSQKSTPFPVFPRNQMVQPLLDMLIKNNYVLLHGPMRWGKSVFARECFCNDIAVKKYFDEIIYLNMNCLRMEIPRNFEWNATRTIFQTDLAFNDFISNAPNKALNSIFLYFLNFYERNKTLIVLDHTDCIPKSQEITSWWSRFARELCSSNHKLNGNNRSAFFNQNKDFHILWIDRSFSLESSNIPISKALVADMEMPLIVERDVDYWLNQSDVNHEISMSDILRITGGHVGLFQDLHLFQKKNNNDRSLSPNLLDSFLNQQKQLYSPEIHYFLKIITRYPEINIDFFRLSHIRKDLIPEDLFSSLWTSGMYNRQKNQYSMYLMSPVFQQRLNKILTEKHRSYLGATYTIEKFFTNIKQSSIESEISAEQLLRTLIEITDYREILKYLKEILQIRFGLRIDIYLRNPDHLLIWEHIETDGSHFKSTPWFQNQHAQQEFPIIFSKAARTGRRQLVGNRCFLPIVGTYGNVGIILVGSLPLKQSVWRNQLFLREIWGYVQAIQPIISKTADCFFLWKYQKSLKDERKKISETPLSSGDDEYGNVIEEAQCVSFALLKRINIYGKNEWIPQIIKSKENPDKDSSESNNYKDYLFNEFDYYQGANQRGIDNIVYNTIQHGLVVSENGKKIFPRIYEKKPLTTLFLQPIHASVSENFIEKLLVVFTFCPTKEQSKEVIDSFKREQLTHIARRISRVFYLKNTWQKKYSYELGLLSEIGVSISQHWTDPEQFIDYILQTIKNIFSVSSISIHDIISVQQKGKNQQKILKVRHSIGYKKNYADYQYKIGSDHEEGKAGFVARTSRTLATWKLYDKKNPQKSVRYELDHDLLLLIPFQEPIRGEDQGAHYLVEEIVQTFLATPIIVLKKDTNEPVTIGVLKVQNRIANIDQNFTSSEILSFFRIGRMLGPFLYMLQNKTNHIFQEQKRAIEIILDTLDFEVSNSLSKIKTSADSAEFELENCNLDEGASRNLLSRIREISEYTSGLYKRFQVLNRLFDSNLEDKTGDPKIIHLEKEIELADKFCRERNIKLEASIIPDHKIWIDNDHFRLAIGSILRHIISILQSNDNFIIRIESAYLENMDSIKIESSNLNLCDEDIHFFSSNITTLNNDMFDGDYRNKVELYLAYLAIEAVKGKINSNVTRDSISFIIILPREK